MRACPLVLPLFILTSALSYVNTTHAELASTDLSQADNDPEKVNLYKSNKFALGVGAAIVVFDTKLKFIDKKRRRKVFIDPEGNLDLPEISNVTTFYGVYNFNDKHGIGFSFFSVNRESNLINIDKNLGEIKVLGQARLSDKTSFYQFNYGYSLFNDARSKITLLAGIYSLDMKYEFEASGEISIDGETVSGRTYEQADVFAPLPLIGLDFAFDFTREWSLAAKVAFVGGRYQDVSAIVLQTGLNAQYKFSRHIGGIIGLASFDAAVNIEDAEKKQEISYSYSGLFMGMHFVF